MAAVKFRKGRFALALLDGVVQFLLLFENPGIFDRLLLAALLKDLFASFEIVAVDLLLVFGEFQIIFKAGSVSYVVLGFLLIFCNFPPFRLS